MAQSGSVSQNLLSNAFKFTEKGKASLQVRAAERRGHYSTEALNQADTVIAFSVTDTGSGIPPEDKDLIMPGQIYPAPRDSHLLVEKGWFALSLEASMHHARPSIDVLFESAAEAYRKQVVGIILTGANDVQQTFQFAAASAHDPLQSHQQTGKFAGHSDDGARGLARIKAYGGLTVMQEPATAEIPALPPAALLTAPAGRWLSEAPYPNRLSQVN